MDIPLGILLALLAVALVKFLLDKTKFGYEMKAVGFSNSASRYAGIHVWTNIVLTMILSGALAGLADVFLLLCVVWALMVITGGNLPGLNEAALGGSIYYTIFSQLNPFMGAGAVG